MNLHHPLDPAARLHEGENFAVYWQDAERSILVLDVFAQWDWAQAFAALTQFNNILYATPYPTYSLLIFRDGTGAVPKGISLPNVRDLMAMNPPLEQLVILVGAGSFIQTMVSTVSKMYGLKAIFGRYRFVESPNAALRLVEQHKREHNL
jgi:hypothetical protein